MSRRWAKAEAGFGELSGSALRLRSVSQPEAKVGTQGGTEVWA